MFNWFRELMEIRYEFLERKLSLRNEITICKSCETLRTALERANFEKNQLLTKVLKADEPVVVSKEELQPIMPKSMPWALRRQMMEKEDREKARLMREAPTPSIISTEDLEKELDNAGAIRSQSTSSTT